MLARWLNKRRDASVDALVGHFAPLAAISLALSGQARLLLALGFAMVGCGLVARWARTKPLSLTSA